MTEQTKGNALIATSVALFLVSVPRTIATCLFYAAVRSGRIKHISSAYMPKIYGNIVLTIFLLALAIWTLLVGLKILAPGKK